MNIEHMAEGNGPQGPETEDPVIPPIEGVTSTVVQRDKEQMALEEAAKARLNEFAPPSPISTTESIMRHAAEVFAESLLGQTADKFAPARQSLRQTYSPEFLEELAKDPKRAGELAALQEALQANAGGGIPEAMVQPIPPEDRDRYGEEWKAITVQMGPYARKINIPAEASKQLQWIRDRLAILENSPESWGGGINATIANEAFAVSNSPELHPEVRQQISGMDGEFVSRQIVHEYFSIYRRSASKDTLIQAAEPVGNNSNYLNVVMHIPEVGKAFGLLESHAQEWLRARGSGYEQVRLNIAEEMANKVGGRKEDFVWAVRLAERVWRFTGRAVFHEDLEPNPFSPGNLRFVGEGAGGDFVLRRVVQDRKWALTDGRAQKEFIDRDDVLNNEGKNSFTFGVNDFWSDNMNAIFRGNYERKGVPFAETKQRIFGNVQEGEVEWNTGDPGKIGEVKVDKLNNMANFNWAEADLTLLGANFGIYMGFFINSAESARAKVMGAAEGLFRKPTYEALKALNDAFDYNGAPSEQGLNTKADLLKRMLKFMSTRNNEVLEHPNIGKLTESRYVTKAVSEKIIDAKRGEDIKDEIFGFPKVELPKWLPFSKNEKGEQKKIPLLPRFLIRWPQYLFLNLAPGGAVFEWLKRIFLASFSLK
jgi:hypothetical protein